MSRSGESPADRGKSKMVQEKCQAILGQLLREDDNKYCVDCDAKGPRWASWNLGIFLCIRCAGIHRNLGVHISKVKSINLDTWTPEQVAYLQNMGNSKARAVYEANLPDNFRRPQTDSSLEAFIRAKYEQKKYIAKEWVEPPPPKPAFDIEEERRKEREKRKSKPKGNVEIPAQVQAVAIPRPHSLTSSSPKPQEKSELLHNQPAAPASADLLGLDVPSVPPSTVPKADDSFTSFLSSAPISTDTSGNVSRPTDNSKAVSGGAVNELSQEANLFNQFPEDGSKKHTLTKESILSLYTTSAPSIPQQQIYNMPVRQPVPPGGMYLNQQQMPQNLVQVGAPVAPVMGMANGMMVNQMPNGNMYQVQRQMAMLNLGGQVWPMNPSLQMGPQQVAVGGPGMPMSGGQTGMVWPREQQGQSLSGHLWQ